ncbi:LytR/AlgR family response regulator transcription factor [Blautia sp. MSJ-19]|uniref:LytR/AlgR family response regulator transcription factor n=1 Tax=Blautia sp. MSJ-19 TaxID=2841517 RepID=UPI001C0EF0CB|nr:LytTR family DNA-binding domain-containing protein [Blautia sp. MSJ-19]MBU5480699.1 LytTR family DNA-binding domain-containing protein [Blautia sp. MSJ-19]
MRIAIVDDIASERTLLHTRLEQQLVKRGVHADLTEFENGESFLKAAKERPFAVLFLDIYMDGANGVEIARELRKSDPDCLLIFTTTSTDHALEGFKVRALHYLVKPYSEKDISDLIDEILSRIPVSGKYIDIKVNGSNIQVPFRSIIYAEHFSHMIHVHTSKAGELVTRQSFEAFHALLKMDPRFYQCNRGIVINLEHAVDFDGTVFVMDNGNQIPVSQKLVKSARETFMEFLFQKGH